MKIRKENEDLKRELENKEVKIKKLEDLLSTYKKHCEYYETKYNEQKQLNERIRRRYMH